MPILMAKSDSTVTLPTTGFRRSAVIVLGMVGAIQVADPLESSLSLVKASDELNFTASMQSLAAGISTLALAAFAISGGLLADRLGRRGILFLSLIVSSAGQILTAVNQDSTTYLIGRVITGMALGITFGSAYAMLRAVSSERSLGGAMAMFNILNGVVPVIVIVVTGALLSVSWRVCYLLLPAIALIMMWFIPAILPKTPRVGSGRVDFAGLVFVGIGLATLLAGISNASKGFDSLDFILPLSVGVVALAIFALIERRAKNPVFPIRLLVHPAFLGAVVMGVFWNFAAGGLSQMLPNVWQYVTHIPSAFIGMGQLSMLAAGIVGSLVAGALLSKGVASRFISGTGNAFMVMAFVDLAIIEPGNGFSVFLLGMVLAGVGYMMNATTQSNLFLTLAPKGFYGAVTSSKMAVGQFGYALGLTGTSTAISILTLSREDEVSKGTVTGEGNWDAITSNMATGSTTNSDLSAIPVAQIQDAYSYAFNMTSAGAAALVFVAGILMFVALSRNGSKVPVDEFIARKA